MSDSIVSTRQSCGAKAPFKSARFTARSEKLSVAQRNTVWLMAFLYLQDIFWLSVSRISLSYYPPMYNVARFEWPLFGLFVIIAVLFAAIAMAAAQMLRPLRKILVPRWVIPGIIVTAILLNFMKLALLADNARYVSGALTGTAGVVNGVSSALVLASIVLFVRMQKLGSPLSKPLFITFMVSLVITIDGLAAALTLGMFMLLILDVRLRRPGRVIVLTVLGLGLLWVGFTAKISEIPIYMTPQFFIQWVIARFSIQAEQMYTFLAGQSVIGNSISYLELILRAISDRFDLVLGRPLTLEYPRSVSEATYYDMMGTYYSGSSPGALLGTALQGPFFFIVVPFVFTFLFLQYFYGITRKVNLVHICAYSFVFKSVHANFSEYLTIISPNLLTVAIFALSCLLVPNTTAQSVLVKQGR